MDRTSITLGEDTRNALREYKHDRELPNYDAALRDLLDGGPSYCFQAVSRARSGAVWAVPSRSDRVPF